jgi:glycosyltransferase involved in cell wall biosynthesis
MRILHCTATFDPASGGPARSVPQLALALARSGGEVGLWSPLASDDGIADLRPEQMEGIPVSSGDFRQCIESFQPDLVHDHGLWQGCHHQVALECRRAGVPRVVSPRGMLEPWALSHKKWKKKLALWAYQRRDLAAAALLHATADSEAVSLRRLGLRNEVAVVPNGVTMPEWHESVQFTRLASGLEPAHRTAVFLSRIQKKKGLPMLVEAWAKVRPAGWRMQVVGPDEEGHLSEVRQMVAAVGLTSSWSFEGPLFGEAKWELLREADLFILPTHSENFGIAVAEALAAGTPVITTRGAPWDGLETRDCGWWTRIDSESIASALADATSLSDRELAAMGGRGRAWVAQAFGWESIADRMMEVYRSIPGMRMKGGESGA